MQVLLPVTHQRALAGGGLGAAARPVLNLNSAGHPALILSQSAIDSTERLEATRCRCIKLLRCTLDESHPVHPPLHWKTPRRASARSRKCEPVLWRCSHECAGISSDVASMPRSCRRFGASGSRTTSALHAPEEVALYERVRQASRFKVQDRLAPESAGLNVCPFSSGLARTPRYNCPTSKQGCNANSQREDTSRQLVDCYGHGYEQGRIASPLPNIEARRETERDSFQPDTDSQRRPLDSDVGS